MRASKKLGPQQRDDKRFEGKTSEEMWRSEQSETVWNHRSGVNS